MTVGSEGDRLVTPIPFCQFWWTDGCVPTYRVIIMKITSESTQQERQAARAETEETIAKWEDLIWLEAMQIIHGKEMGLAKFRWLRMGGPNPYGEDRSG